MKNNIKNSVFTINLIDYSILSDIRVFINNELANSGLNEIEIQKVVVAIDEICTNLIKHALGYKAYELKKKENLKENLKDNLKDNIETVYTSDSNFNRVVIEIELEEDKLIIKISDITESFNILDMPDTNMSNYFKLFKSGGLGIKLVKLIMDEIEYTPANNKINQNTLTLTKYLPK